MGNYCFQCEELHDDCKAHAMVEKKVVKVTTRKVAAAKAALTIDDLLGRPHDPRVVAIASARRGDTVAPVICSDCNTESLYDPCHWCQELRTTKQRIEEREREREIARIASIDPKFNWPAFRHNALAVTMVLTPLIALGWVWFMCGFYEGIVSNLTWSLYHKWKREQEIAKAKRHQQDSRWVDTMYWDILDGDPNPGQQAIICWVFMNAPMVLTILAFVGNS